MKYLKYLSVFIVGIAVCYGLARGISALVGNSEKPAASQTAACTKKGQNHLVIMHGNTATPDNVTAKLCDTLTIKNVDNQIRLVAFGPHEHHVAYDGVLERTLQQNQSVTVTLNKTGTYHFHDHLQDEVRGDFTVVN